MRQHLLQHLLRSCQSKCHLCPHSASPTADAPAALGPVALTEVLPSGASASASASAKVVPVYAAASPAHSASLGAVAPAALPLGSLASPSPSGLGVPSAVPVSPSLSVGEERTFGVPWTPEQFVQKASHARHPRDLLQCIPVELKESIDYQVNSSPVDLAKSRTESMRHWVLRAKELRDLGEDLPMNDRCRRILGSKSMSLFSASGYGDQQICKDIADGFELLGTMPRSSVMPAKTVVASVGIDELRQVAHLNQKATWAAVADSGRKNESKAVLEEIYKLTQEECAKGWMYRSLNTWRR